MFFLKRRVLNLRIISSISQNPSFKGFWILESVLWNVLILIIISYKVITLLNIFNTSKSQQKSVMFRQFIFVLKFEIFLTYLSCKSQEIIIFSAKIAAVNKQIGSHFRKAIRLNLVATSGIWVFLLFVNERRKKQSCKGSQK